MTAPKPVGSTDSFDEFGIFVVGTADNFFIQQVKAVDLVLSEQLGLFLFRIGSGVASESNIVKTMKLVEIRFLGCDIC